VAANALSSVTASNTPGTDVAEYPADARRKNLDASSRSSLSRLSALAEDVTVLVLRDALRRRAGEFLAEQATRLDQAGTLDGLRPQARAAGLDV
jgi:hypothetical protein